jgi:hypothetical protein
VTALMQYLDKTEAGLVHPLPVADKGRVEETARPALREIA